MRTLLRLAAPFLVALAALALPAAAQAAPVNTTRPAVSGPPPGPPPQIGETLTGTQGTWNGAPPGFARSYSFQWRRCTSATNAASCSDIPGATANMYTLTAPADVGRFIVFRVTATDSPLIVGTPSSTSASSDPTQAVLPDPANLNPPTISGPSPPRDTNVLTANTGDWRSKQGGLTFKYQWERCNSSGGACSNISGATAASYTLADADVGHAIRVVVTARNSGAAQTPATSGATAAIQAIPPSNSVAPSVNRSGRTLTANNGTWDGHPAPTLARQWLRCTSATDTGTCSSISGATGGTYRLVTADIGKFIRLRVTGSNAGGSLPLTTDATGPIAASPPVNFDSPTISGSPHPGELLTGTRGSWNGEGPFTYRINWLRCSTSSSSSCSLIAGAGSLNYRLTAADLNRFVRLRVIADGLGSTEARSEALRVTPAPPPPPPTLLAPFPRIAIAGRAFRNGARLSKLAVRAPSGTKVVLRCKGRRCPYSRSATHGHGKTIRFRKMQRGFTPGTIIRVWVISKTRIGKYTRFRIRSLRAPKRSDRCLPPNSSHPIKCP